MENLESWYNWTSKSKREREAKQVAKDYEEALDFDPLKKEPADTTKFKQLVESKINSLQANEKNLNKDMSKYKEPEWMHENIHLINESDIAQYATASTPETDSEKQRNIENLISRLINHCIKESNSQVI